MTTYQHWQAGLARTDITAFEPGVSGVFGWGRSDLRLRSVAVPIHARALVLRGAPGRADLLVVVCVELCFISVALREAVIEALDRDHPEIGLTRATLILSATHSHGGPGGLANHLFYAAETTGMSPTVFDAVVAGVVDAVVLASERCEPARLRFAEAEIPLSEPVAFNRSLSAFARNPEAPAVPETCPELGTRRISAVLRVEALDGRALGLVNWFGVHGTSAHAEVERVHGDNKGIAATLVEQRMAASPDGSPEFVAIFAQEAAGDVSPNFAWDPQRKVQVAGFADDFDCARANGEIQARYALEALTRASRAAPIPAAVEAVFEWIDMTGIPVDPEFVAVQTGAPAAVSSASPAIGVTLALGTSDGPGPLWGIRDVLRAAVELRHRWGPGRRPDRDAKLVMLVETSEGVGAAKFLAGIPLRRALELFGQFDSTVGFVRDIHAEGLADEPLLPEILPVQIVRLGPLTIVALPFEPTTIAGQRIRATVQAALGPGPVVISACANDYAGYLTTFEEYAEQGYEGGATLFGPWSLDACRTVVAAMLADQHLPGFTPDHTPRFDRARSEQQHLVGRRSKAAADQPPSEAANGPVLRRPGWAPLAPLAPERDGRYHPRDETEVQALIRFARATGREVRVVGAQHSIAAAIHPSRASALELRLDQLVAVEFDDAARQVRVGAGCHLGLDPRDPSGRSDRDTGLCAQLEARGWALASLGGISHQTVAGFLATGSAGGSSRWSLAERVVGLRLVDGLGECHELDRDRDPESFAAALTSLGLLGVVTEVRIQCEPSYRILGREITVPRADASVDLEAEGDAGVMAFFAAHDYARILWWPQPQVDRLVIWTGARAPADPQPEPARAREYEAFPRILGSRIPMQAAAGEALDWIARVGGVREQVATPGLARAIHERGLAVLYRGFIPLEPPREFSEPWTRGIALDDQIDERWMPVCFTEIWIGAAEAGEALRRLAALFARDGYAATQNFACELYPGKASEGWLHPGYRRDSLRINLFWLERSAGDPAELWFPRIHAALADLDPRMHWGKHLARDPALIRAVARSYPQRDAFLRLRERFDPDGLFASRYWQTQLGFGAGPNPEPDLERLEPAAAAPPASAPRPLFVLDDAPLTSAPGRQRVLREDRVVSASLARVEATLRDRGTWLRWVPGLREVTPLTPSTTELRLGRLRLRLADAHDAHNSDADSHPTVAFRVTASELPVLTDAKLVIALRRCGPHSTEIAARLELQLPALLDRGPIPPALERQLQARLRETGAALALELDRRAWLDRQPALTEPRPRPLLGPRPPEPVIAVPPVFRMAPAGPALLHRARHHLRASARIPASALTVDHAITRFEGAEQWLAQFLGVRWLTETREGPGAVFDEHFTFMTLRVRTLEHEPGRRWFALCEACSLPLATHMVEEMRFEPISDTETQLLWHVAFDTSALLRPGVGIVGGRFEAWMQQCADRLAALHAR